MNTLHASIIPTLAFPILACATSIVACIRVCHGISLLLPRHCLDTLALLAQKRRVACLSKSMSYRRHRQTPNEKHEQKTRHADTLRDASYISSFSFRKFWRFSCKAKYARMRTLLRSLLGFCSSSFQPCNVPRRIKGFGCRLISF